MAGPDAVLDQVHLDTLNRAIWNVLSTEQTLQTCSQIADGLPLASVAFGQYGSRCEPSHPVARHTALCPGALETAWDFLSEFTLDTLDFDEKLLKAYQAATPGYRSFQFRLIELVAVSIHKVAERLFMRRHRIHDRENRDRAYTVDAVTAWQSSWPRLQPAPTLLTHISYDALGQYPQGLADVVGYWAENRILGGVILFDRSEAWDDGASPEPNIYLHSDCKGTTSSVWQALDEQQQALVDFFLAPSAARTCPFPLSASDGPQSKRLDPAHAMAFQVYRDIWERAPPKKEDELGPYSRRTFLDSAEQFS